MITAPKLDQASITPELIVETARRYKLQLLPGAYFRRTFFLRRIYACCAESALALIVNPDVNDGLSVEWTLSNAGLTFRFRCGLCRAFDGKRFYLNDSISLDGYNLGLAIRRLVGLDTVEGDRV